MLVVGYMYVSAWEVDAQDFLLLILHSLLKEVKFSQLYHARSLQIISHSKYFKTCPEQVMSEKSKVLWINVWNHAFMSFMSLCVHIPHIMRLF